MCDFESVIQALERVVLDGHIRKVFSMELGYVLYTDPKYLGKGENITVEYYYAVPTWVVQCIYVTKPRDEYVVEDPMTERYCMEAATLLVNAQTGELQEYLGNPTDKRAFYRGFTPWDEIGATR